MRERKTLLLKKKLQSYESWSEIRWCGNLITQVQNPLDIMMIMSPQLLVLACNPNPVSVNNGSWFDVQVSKKFHIYCD